MKSKIQMILKNRQCRYAFIMSVIIGIVSHGYMLTNKYSYHDDLNYLFNAGNTWTYGRWGLGILYNIVEKFLGGGVQYAIF